MLKRFLFTMLIILWVTGCQQTPSLETKNQESSQTKDEQNDMRDKSSPIHNKQDDEGLSKEIIDLTFNPVPIGKLSEQQPKNDWKKIKTISFGKVQKQEVTLEMYTEKENEKPYTNGNVYAFLKFKDDARFIGNVSPSYGFDDVETQVISEEFGDLFLIGGIGTKYTGWVGIGYEANKDRFVQFNTIGKPKFVNLDKNNQTELVGVFEGVHLQPPNVIIFHEEKDTLKMANINEAVGLQNGYVILKQVDGKWLFKIGLLSNENEEQLFRKEGQKLIKIE